jgi:hypothetical protein
VSRINRRTALTSLLGFTVAACGGGAGGDDGEPTNNVTDAPQGNATSAGSGGQTAATTSSSGTAGTTAPSLPSVTVLPVPGRWLELTGTPMSAVAPGRAGHPGWGVSGPRSVTDAWGGGAFDTRRNVLLLTGGGHGDYGGNEVYEFSLQTRTWTRTTEPSPMRELEGGKFEVLGSQAPVSSHSYDGLVFVPGAGAMFKFGGAGYRSGSAYDQYAYLYDTATRTWQRRAPAPRHCLQVVSDLDASTNRVIVGTETGLMQYDVAADQWQQHSQNNGFISASGAVLDPATGRFVVMQAKSGAIDFYDLHDPNRRRATPITGTLGWGRHAGMAYDSRRRRIVIWDGGADVWLLRPDDWTVEKQPAEGPAPSAQFADGRRKSAGIYSRWQYVPDLDAFIAYQHFEDNVWLYSPPA